MIEVAVSIIDKGTRTLITLLATNSLHTFAFTYQRTKPTQRQSQKEWNCHRFIRFVTKSLLELSYFEKNFTTQ